MSNYIEKMFEFIESSPTAFHTIRTVSDRLVREGYEQLFENAEWKISDGGKYFVVRGDGSLIAFRKNSDAKGFMICASHSDFPSLKVKSEKNSGAYVTLSVEKYGGAILYSWFDRPLSVAGRVVIKTDKGIRCEYLNIHRDLLVIPSVAIHQNRAVNDGFKPNVAQDMLPLLSVNGAIGDFDGLIAKELSIDAKDILSHDLFLYSRSKPTRIGARGDFILSPRLDNLTSVYSSLEGFLSSESKATPVLAIFDNEEVGSDTKQGAASSFLLDTLMRICETGEKYLRMLPNSLMVSADNAHAVHPNHPELSDSPNPPKLSGGVVIKHNANQRYATDGASAALFSLMCERAGIKTQDFYSRADLPCGSTLGSISDTRVSVLTVDVGIPQLAMHSAVETAAVSDVEDMIKVLKQHYSSEIYSEGNEIMLK